VEPSTPSWRVLDSPAQGTATEAAAPAATSPLRSWVPLACFALAAVLAIAAFAVAASGAGAVRVDGATLVDDPEALPSGSAAVGGPLVEVSGAVVAPGVYRLPSGSRVIDAITAAGGFGPRVDTVRADRELNLAAPVTDGVEIRVPSRDDPVASGPSGGGQPTAGVTSLVDLNRATEAELEALPGVGPATVAKIVAARPFASIDELRSKGVVGDKTLEKLRPLVTVGP
jgi:competence protein ComEA